MAAEEATAQIEPPTVADVNSVLDAVALLKSATAANKEILQTIDVTVGLTPEQQQAVAVALDALVGGIRNPQGNPTTIEKSVSALTFLLRHAEVREPFAQRNGIPALNKLVVYHTNNVQLIYHAGFCLWLLSYSPAVEKVMHQNEVVATLHEIVKNKKEKCQRVALLTLRNFTRTSDPMVLSAMIGVGMVRTLTLSVKRNFADPDLGDQYQSLLDLLEKNIEDTTSFVDYRQEIFSGRIDWTPVHTTERFWKENLSYFTAEDSKILRQVAEILSTTEDPKVQAVLCSDLGQFVKYHPQGRKIINSLNIKAKILELMSSPNEAVAKQALLCTQKIMIQKWEYLKA